MAKAQIKSEQLTPFGGIFSIMEQFDSMLSPIIDRTLGQRCRSIIGYKYSEIVRSLMSVYFCGGSCVEDVTSHLMPHLSLHPTLRTCSSDTILRGISELSCANTTYTSDTGKVYDFNTATKLNSLLVKVLMNTGQLVAGASYDLDFDHQFIETEKYDAKMTYKKFTGYSPGVAVIGDLIVGIEHGLNSILTEKWEGKAYRLVIQRQRRVDGNLDLWEGEYTYRCILTNDYTSTNREVVEFYNLRGGKERIFDDMNNGFGLARLPKSFMAENTDYKAPLVCGARHYLPLYMASLI